MSRTPPAWPRPDGGGGASAPTSRSPSGPPSRVGARPQRARVRPPSSAPPWGRSTGHRRTAASQAARATAPEAQGAARSARSHCADASHPGPRARVRCSGRVTARSSAGQSSSPPRHPRSCDPALTTRSPESASSRSDPGPTGASLPDRPRSDDQQPAPWLASAPHGAPAYPLFNNPGILNPSPSPGARMIAPSADASPCVDPARSLAPHRTERLTQAAISGRPSPNRIPATAEDRVDLNRGGLPRKPVAHNEPASGSILGDGAQTFKVTLAIHLQEAGRRGCGRRSNGAGHEGHEEEDRYPHGLSLSSTPSPHGG